MRRPSLAERLMLLPATVLVLTADAATRVWRNGRCGCIRLAHAGPLAALHTRIGRLPPALALLLFLVPEACSRGGWFTSAWLLMEGQARTALLVYAGTKLTAGVAAVWIFSACEPSLMQVRWFAALYRWSDAKCRACRASLLPSRRRSRLLLRARLILAQRRPGGG